MLHLFMYSVLSPQSDTVPDPVRAPAVNPQVTEMEEVVEEAGGVSEEEIELTRATIPATQTERGRETGSTTTSPVTTAPPSPSECYRLCFVLSV